MTDERQPTQAELLAPWSLTRKLGKADEATVQAALSDADFARQMSLGEDERRGTVEVSERIPGPSRASLETLMAMIEAEPKRSPGVWSKVKSAFNSFGISGAPAGALMAGLAMVVFVQGGMLTQPGAISLDAPIPQQAPPETIAPQGSTRNLTAGEATVLRVIFRPEATMGEVATLLDSLGGNIVSGPTQDFYSIIFESKASATMALTVLNSNGTLVVTASAPE